MATTAGPRPSTYAGLFFITLATLMNEILLTRIFSVAIWYHFAFMAISVAMFGMTAGAIWVYLRSSTFTVERAPGQLAENALLYALSLAPCCLLFLVLPIDANPDLTLEDLGVWAVGYTLISVPFVFSGITVAIALTKYPRHVNRLYAADLVGAALGCILLIVALDVAGGATSLVIVSAFAAAGAAFFAWPLRSALRSAALGAVGILSALSVYHGILERQNQPIIEITDAMNNPTSNFRYIRWNSHSRVGVFGDPDRLQPAAGWGLSNKTKARKAKSRFMMVTIDTFAATPITAYDGDTGPHWYLKDDVTNMAHWIRRDADVAVVGVGGGRDVLSALTFDQNSVLGVELNENVLGAVTDVFTDFSGHLGDDPRVTLVHDEARSFITRTDQRFDIIQLSLIDTFAATAAGAFVLSENALYTADAWETFLSKLAPGGVLTVSRWFYPTRPAEAMRLVSLGREALRRIGKDDARSRIILVKAPEANGPAGQLGNGVANVLVSPDPFSAEDIARLEEQAERLGFEILVGPTTRAPGFDEILDTPDPAEFYANYPLDLSPPTDDHPFFFHMLRFSDWGDDLAENLFDPNHHQLKAIRLLVGLLVVVGILTALCLIVPLILTTRRGTLKGNGSLLLFFFCIGMGFMFVEMSQMQRLMVMLGHPTYALSVVLFTLLVGTGIGSYLSSRVTDDGPLRPRAALGLLLGVLVLFGLVTPVLVDLLAGASTPLRVGLAAVTLFVAGLFLGLPFPLGMRRAAARAEGLMPWLWGINGAASVLCSVVAAAVALSMGISASFWAGVGFYVLALVTLPRPAPVTVTSGADPTEAEPAPDGQPEPAI